MDQGGPNPPPAPTIHSYGQLSPTSAATQAFDAQYIHHGGENDITLAEALAQHNAGGDHAFHDAGGSNGQSATDTASAALHYSMTVPTSTEATFMAQNTNDTPERPSDPSIDLGNATNVQQDSSTFSNEYSLDSLKDGTRQTPQQQQQQGSGGEGSPTSGSAKPTVGTEEWHKVRRDNHKEGENRF